MTLHNSRFTSNHKLGVLLFLVFLLPSVFHAQDQQFRNDFETWFYIGLDKKMSDRLDLSLRIADRLDKNATEQKSFFLEPEVQLGIVDGVNTSLAYRYIIDPVDGDTRQRFISSTSFGYRLKPFKISYRVRLDNDLGNNDIVDVIRNRISIGYSRKKSILTPKISYAIFTENTNSGFLYNRWRLTLSTGIKLKKRNVLKLFYIIQREVNQAAPRQDFVAGVGYNYSFKRRKKKEKTEN